MPASIFYRDRYTWLAYLLLAFYGYYLNILGPITPFLKSELQLSYTISSLHFTAFAVGILLTGLIGHTFIQRIGRGRSLWIGAFGISAAAWLLMAGRSAVITIGAAFGMGLIGSLILVIVPAALSDRHGEKRVVALSEANFISSIVCTAAPLMVGGSADLLGGWRLALGIAGLVPVLMFFGFRRALPKSPASSDDNSTTPRQPLPILYWVYWAAIVLAVSVEFCMIFWSADYLESSQGLWKADAARAVSLFLGGMIFGRLAVSRLVSRFPAHRVIIPSIVVAIIGFALFWATGNPILCLTGLFITGLGVAGLYPLILSLAIGTAGRNTVQASVRATLASGTAILVLPLVLGSLADGFGIRYAYGVVPILLIGVFLIIIATATHPAAQTPA